jgi:hypothetical protein
MRAIAGTVAGQHLSNNEALLDKQALARSQNSEAVSLHSSVSISE